MTELQKFALENRLFWWWVKDVTELSERSIFEWTLSYGDFNDKKRLIELLWPKKFAAYLQDIAQEPRPTVQAATMEYWNDYVRRYQTHA